jgi:DNA-binding response OmpR family regulator
MANSSKTGIPICSIFIADDDNDDLLFFRDALEKIDKGIKLETVGDGNALLSLLSHLKPDLLFLDLDMPGKNGLECLVEIRSNLNLSQLPIVVFSSTTRPANIETAYEMGADLFFIKPPNYNDLISSISAILKLNWSSPEKVKEQYCVNGRYVAFM